MFTYVQMWRLMPYLDQGLQGSVLDLDLDLDPSEAADGSAAAGAAIDQQKK